MQLWVQMPSLKNSKKEKKRNYRHLNNDRTRRKENTMGREKLKFDYLIEYSEDIKFLQDGLSLRRVRAKTGRSVNTLRKLRKLFHISPPV